MKGYGCLQVTGFGKGVEAFVGATSAVVEVNPEDGHLLGGKGRGVVVVP